MVYLSSPYSHPDHIVREERFRAACEAAAKLMRLGFVVFSPVVHSHPIANCGLPTEWAFWERQDRDFLERCDEVIVLTLDGWSESIGVQAELQIAEELGKPVRYLSPDAPTLARVPKEKEL
jgi:nucleoside 2-deoxyribosyltransferase